MTKLKLFFQLIRYKNLIIIALTMYAIRYGIIYPFLNQINYSLQFDEFHFALLVFATMCIAAAGYAINDYFDIRSDISNHPESVIVGTKLSRRAALTINNILNFIGVALGFYISYHIHLTKLGFLFLFISGILWFYSSYFKRMLLWGNIVVAFFSAIVPLLPVLYEIPLLNNIISHGRPPVEAKTVSVIFLFALGYAYFAFLLTLMREIVKDMEDIQGDSELQRNTLPLVLGINKSKWIVHFIALIVIVSILFIYFLFFQDIASFLYITFTIIIPLVYLQNKLHKAQGNKEFYKISQQLKFIMFFGLAFVVILWFTL
ncbi:MAG: geranylgeranylglycerol-phosphate geranylgeranyltransferase [Bacteroidales bacterium]|nr:geranylgeranylglycerol-phosphate geranylgeranyltransferase [Bacteroidales bacterium]